MKQIWAAIFPTEGREAAIVIDAEKKNNTTAKTQNGKNFEFDRIFNY